MPWLVGTALIHSLAVTEKRGGFKSWTVLLAIAAFSLSLLGTFLVRSGVLTSVHAFATDPKRGIFILAFLVHRDRRLACCSTPGARSRSGWAASLRWSRASRCLLSNNVLLTVAAGFGSARHALSADHRRAGHGQALGWATLLQQRLCAADGAGNVPDGRRTNRALEESEPSGAGGATALGVSGQRGDRADRFLSYLGKWKPLVSLGLLLALWIVTTCCVNLWERVKSTSGQLNVLQKLRMQSSQLLRHAAGPSRRGGFHCRRHDRHRLSIRAGRAHGHRRHGERRRIRRFSFNGVSECSRTKLPRPRGRRSKSVSNGEVDRTRCIRRSATIPPPET